MKTFTLALVAGALALLATMPAQAENAMTGNWKIDKADPAPWSDAKDYPPDSKGAKVFVGKRLSFTVKRITGPSLLACAHPNYDMKDYTADMLFQGQLGEAEQRGGKKAEDAATSLGFKARPVRTLETGCEGAIDFHMTDADHAAFALNNMIFWLTRQHGK
jgi:hypothetical protein